ncbi:phage capsid protein [Rhizorhabdus histidinilytica]|uniref:phage capsid protein n=1 Tax=Rhizorhabdus histidinilytica TaxID=439228 RepID=UPI001F293DE9|nr:phage capsid protein [Rhizorhabdus histidinilytica]
MPDTAFQTQYRQEFIASFEQHQSLARELVTTEAVIKGNQATFLVAGSGGATAVTRGVNGLIPARADDNTQKTAMLVEWHDLVRKTNFNVFASQGNQREIMQMTTMAVINRKIDSDIITTLNTGTLDTGAAATASLNMALRSKTILGNNGVPFDGQIGALITPAFEAYLLMIKEFANADYVTKKPMENAETAWKDQPGFYRWLGVNWVVHPNLPGAGTSAEKCFMFHKSAIGHAANTEGLQTPVGYDEEQAYSWARASIDMGAVLLQNSGVIVMNHDGSAFAAE